MLLQLVAPLAIFAAAGALTQLSAANATIDRMQEQVLRMNEFLDTMLPGVLDEHNMTLHFKPKFSDLRDEEYMRFPLELRYGLRHRWELAAGITPFTPSPFNQGRDHRWGPGEIKLGARHDLGRLFNFFQQTTVGLETRIPWGEPPVELIDHYTHVKPFVSTARTLLRWPSTTFYANLSYDRTVKLTRRDAPPPEVTRFHVIEVAPGLLFRPSEFAYFAEYRFRHIAVEHGSRLAHEIQFGTIWDVPIERTEKFNLPGKWQVELGYKLGHEEGHEHYHGFLARVNWRTAVRAVHEEKKGPRSKFGR